MKLIASVTLAFLLPASAQVGNINCYLTNSARQVVDYFHSAWLDSTFSYWAGIHVSDKRDKVTFDPFTKEDFTLRKVPAGGRELTFTQESGQRRILDAEGKVLAEDKGLLELPIPR